MPSFHSVKQSLVRVNHFRKYWNCQSSITERVHSLINLNCRSKAPTLKESVGVVYPVIVLEFSTINTMQKNTSLCILFQVTAKLFSICFLVNRAGRMRPTRTSWSCFLLTIASQMVNTAECYCTHPRRCENEYIGTKFKKSYWGLYDVPCDIPANTNHISLIGNNITSLPAHSFTHVPFCQILNLAVNRITLVAPGAFDALTSCTKLALEVNCISHLTAGIFRNMSRCRTLQLHQNKLQILVKWLFWGLSGLKKLSLHHNSIKIVQKGVFDHLHLLKRISLGGNKLTALRADLFINMNRPLVFTHMQSFYLAKCSSMGWLRHEEHHKTIIVDHDRGHKNFDRWNQKYCSDPGKIYISSMTNKQFLLCNVWIQIRWASLHPNESQFHFQQSSPWQSKHIFSTTNASIYSKNSHLLHVGTCPEPGGIPYSRRLHYTGPYNKGCQVHYLCHNGVNITTTCQSDGTWTRRYSCAGQFVSLYFIYFVNKLLPQKQQLFLCRSTCTNTCIFTQWYLAGWRHNTN